VQLYLDAAKDMGMKITHVLETHLHADFISGHLDLAEKTGAAIYVPKSAGCTFSHVGVAEGDTFAIEDMTVTVLDTPGHTLNISVMRSLTVRGVGNPQLFFAGHTLLW